MPRAARAEGVPLIAFDHQHVLAAYDLSTLPRDLQRHAWWMSWVVWWCYPGPHEVMASAFYAPPLKPGWEHVRQVGGVIADGVNVEKHRAGNVRRGELGDRIALLAGHVPGRIHDPDLAQMGGQPFGGDEIAH